MKIIILAGGEGKRMWPITTDKCLIPFLGSPLLYHNLKKIKAHLDEEFVIVTTPRSKDAVSKIADDLGLTYKIAVQQQPKGMGDAILSGKSEIKGEVLIINAEDILDGQIYKEVAKGGVDVVLAAKKLDKYFPGGYIKGEGGPSTGSTTQLGPELTAEGLTTSTLRTGRVQGMVEKPGEGNEPSDLVKLVVDYFKDGEKLVSYLEKVQSEKDDVYEIALDKMISDGLEVSFVKYEGEWIPLKYPWQILDITSYFLSNIDQQISPGAKVSEKAIIEGNVVIEDGAKVFEGAVIKGPAFIGKNVIVGNNSMIRESILEQGCVTGFNSDITRSYIGSNSWFHTNYVGDSIIEGDFGMGSGAVLANLRLDDRTIRVKVNNDLVDSGRHKLGLIAGKGSRVGVNASTMPGVKIGSNSLVGPGVTLYEDVKDNTKILVKQQYEVSEHTPQLTSYEQFREKFK